MADADTPKRGLNELEVLLYRGLWDGRSAEDMLREAVTVAEANGYGWTPDAEWLRSATLELIEDELTPGLYNGMDPEGWHVGRAVLLSKRVLSGKIDLVARVVAERILEVDGEDEVDGTEPPVVHEHPWTRVTHPETADE